MHKLRYFWNDVKCFFGQHEMFYFPMGGADCKNYGKEWK